jgi:hypothetical protein
MLKSGIVLPPIISATQIQNMYTATKRSIFFIITFPCFSLKFYCKNTLLLGSAHDVCGDFGVFSRPQADAAQMKHLRKTSCQKSNIS